MTIDERLEIGSKLDSMIRKCRELLADMETMQDQLGEISKEPQRSSKEKFLEKY